MRYRTSLASLTRCHMSKDILHCSTVWKVALKISKVNIRNILDDDEMTNKLPVQPVQLFVKFPYLSVDTDEHVKEGRVVAE